MIIGIVSGGITNEELELERKNASCIRGIKQNITGRPYERVNSLGVI